MVKIVVSVIGVSPRSTMKEYNGVLTISRIMKNFELLKTMWAVQYYGRIEVGHCLILRLGIRLCEYAHSCDTHSHEVMLWQMSFDGPIKCQIRCRSNVMVISVVKGSALSLEQFELKNDS